MSYLSSILEVLTLLSYMSKETNVSTSKLQCKVENTCVNKQLSYIMEMEGVKYVSLHYFTVVQKYISGRMWGPPRAIMETGPKTINPQM